MLNLKPGQKVLDVGCGIGGGDFYMAKVGVGDINNIQYLGNVIKKKPNRIKIPDLWSRSYWPGSFREHGEHCHGEGHR